MYICICTRMSLYLGLPLHNSLAFLYLSLHPLVSYLYLKWNPHLCVFVHVSTPEPRRRSERARGRAEWVGVNWLQVKVGARLAGALTHSAQAWPSSLALGLHSFPVSGSGSPLARLSLGRVSLSCVSLGARDRRREKGREGAISSCSLWKRRRIGRGRGKEKGEGRERKSETEVMQITGNESAGKEPKISKI